MKKTLLAFSAVSLLATGAAKAQTYYLPLQDFNGVTAPALPANWTSAPTSQWKTGAPNILAPVTTQVVGSLNVAAHTAALGIDGSAVAADSAVISSPVFAIPSGATTAAFSYDQAFFSLVRGDNPTKPETLTFIVSTDGGTTWTNVANITADTVGTWEARTIPMGTYAGQSNLKVGFRYNNSKLAIAGAVIDNAKVWTGTDIIMLGASGTDHPAGTTDYQIVGTAATIQGSVQNLGTTNATAAAIWYSSNGGAPVNGGNVTTNPIVPAGYSNFTFSFTPAAAQVYTLKTWVVYPGDQNHANDTTTVTVQGVASIPAKKLVFEEGTSTSCVWCPRGTVNMDGFAASHPGVAAQIAVHQPLDDPDPMQITTYYQFMSPLGGGGIPNIVVDRSFYDDPSNMVTDYSNNMNNFGFADMTMSTPTIAAGVVTVPFTVKPALAINNPKVLLVVTESNVTKPTGATGWWQQSNNYAGGASGVMGGFEVQPNPVPANLMNYNFVSRVLSPATPGGAAPTGMPSALVTGTTYNSSLTATLDPSWNTANLQYIVMLIDGTTGDVMNSVFSALPTLNPPIATAITNVSAGIEKASLYPNPSTSDKVFVEVDLKNATTGNITIVDATGRTVATQAAKQLHTGNNVLEVSTASLSNGLYFVNLNTEKGNISLKLQVIK